MGMTNSVPLRPFFDAASRTLEPLRGCNGGLKDVEKLAISRAATGSPEHPKKRKRGTGGRCEGATASSTRRSDWRVEAVMLALRHVRSEEVDPDDPGAPYSKK
ncbi:hypothetical protein SETIT_9G036100v2 [Setaria italica]|uniref:Uncharacterized protein n=2 Tax=Setaria TaxID=4554 RepID=A0A368SCZ2_SETIT|nr:hypothetical protein SETIT_9G036100v2 [Setaria italica]